MARIVGPSDATQTSPVWAGDFMSRDHLVPGPLKLDASAFPSDGAVKAVVAVAGALVDATSVPVAALSGPIPNGTALYFGGAKKLAVLTAAAAAGATALTVQALPTALVSGDTATYEPTPNIVPIRSGMPVGRTLAERNAGTAFGPAVSTDDEIFLVAFSLTNGYLNGDFEAYRHGSQVKEDLLPEWGNTDIWEAGLVTVLRGLYLMTLSDMEAR